MTYTIGKSLVNRIVLFLRRVWLLSGHYCMGIHIRWGGTMCWLPSLYKLLSILNYADHSCDSGCCLHRESAPCSGVYLICFSISSLPLHRNRARLRRLMQSLRWNIVYSIRYRLHFCCELIMTYIGVCTSIAFPCWYPIGIRHSPALLEWSMGSILSRDRRLGGSNGCWWVSPFMKA